MRKLPLFLFLAAAQLVLPQLTAGVFAAEGAQFKPGQEQELREAAEGVQRACGTKIETEIDWPSFVGKEPLRKGRSVSGYCDEPLAVLADLCSLRGEVHEAKRFVCRFGGPDKSELHKDNETIIWTIDWNAVDHSGYLKRQLISLFFEKP